MFAAFMCSLMTDTCCFAFQHHGVTLPHAVKQTCYNVLVFMAPFRRGDEGLHLSPADFALFSSSFDILPMGGFFAILVWYYFAVQTHPHHCMCMYVYLYF